MVGEFPISTGQVQNPYREFNITIPAGQYSEPIYFAFDYVRILNAEYTPVTAPVNDGTILAQFHGSGDLTEIANAGIGLKLPQAIPSIRFRNSDGASAINIRVALAIGEIFDDRFNVIGDVSVINGSVTPLQTNDASAITALNSIDGYAASIDTSAGTISNALTDSETGRELHTLIPSGISYATVNNATTTLVAGGSNPNGVILRHGSIACDATGGLGYLAVSAVGNKYARASGTNISVQIKNVFVAAGLGVIAHSSSANVWVDLAYEVL